MILLWVQRLGHVSFILRQPGAFEYFELEEEDILGSGRGACASVQGAEDVLGCGSRVCATMSAGYGRGMVELRQERRHPGHRKRDMGWVHEGGVLRGVHILTCMAFGASLMDDVKLIVTAVPPLPFSESGVPHIESHDCTDLYGSVYLARIIVAQGETGW